MSAKKVSWQVSAAVENKKWRWLVELINDWLWSVRPRPQDLEHTSSFY